MGGGPRTFPGGVNKWKWKRMHEKRAREKENRLLQQEKQIYEARIRSQIRAKLSGIPDPSANTNQQPSSVHSAMTPQDHIKALANRFMKAGAEDLWNEDDGPLKSPPPPPSPPTRSTAARRTAVGSNGRPASIGSPLDLRKLISDGRNIASNRESVSLNNTDGANFVNTRNFSVQRRRGYRKSESSSREGDNDNDSAANYSKFMVSGGSQKGKNMSFRNVNDYIKNNRVSGQRNQKYIRNDSSSGESELDSDSKVSSRWPRFTLGGTKEELDSDDDLRNVRNVRDMGSSASLGKVDVKTKRRAMPMTALDDERYLSQQVELIRHELGKRKVEAEDLKAQNETFLTQKRFDECGISSLTVKALSSARYIYMTRVQENTVSVSLEGKDALVKARTGTGKSLAFLLPAIETVLNATQDNTNLRVPSICVLIICPTRELASQIAAEAKVLLQYHNGIGVSTLVGGTRFKVDQKRLESDACQILVATPGRLLDHIENKSGISVRLMGLKMLVLDEVDRLLDLGFRKDIERIVDCLPRQRQSLLFSATIPKEVRRVSQLVLKREHALVDKVGLASAETPAAIKQSYLVAPHELHFQLVHHLLKEHILQSPDYKVIVFCTTGMVTSLLYLFLREMKMNAREIHSRKPQIYRTRVSDEFKESKQIILVSSDVSAHGMNYPDVTLVIQMGIPSDREQYIHRIGRTGREGKDGHGILLIAPWEEYFLDVIKDLPLQKFSLPDVDQHANLKMEEAMAKIDNNVKEAAYHAWLGYYNSIREISREKSTLAELASKFSQSIGLQRPPALFRKTALKLGLKDIPGIRIRQ